MKLTEQMVKEAIEIATPTVMEIVAASLSEGKQGISVVVMFGHLKGRGMNHTRPELTVTTQIGSSKEKYDDIAMRKAKLSWRTGTESEEIAKSFYNAILLEEDQDCAYSGSHVLNIGDVRLVVAASGLKEREDTPVSMIIETLIMMVVNRKVTSAEAPNADGIIH